LRIRVREDIGVVFGRFGKGRPVPVPEGEYGYVGSALGGQGASSLGPRLLRHATRSGSRPPHSIRAAMTGRGKTLRWHIDHLLDRLDAELVSVIALRSPERLEPVWGRLLEEDSHTHVVEKGLGAGDAPGDTRLLRVEADEGWWAGLPRRLSACRCRNQP